MRACGRMGLTDGGDGRSMATEVGWIRRHWQGFRPRSAVGLGKGDGDLMVDVVIGAEGWWFLVGQNGLTVTGAVVNTKGKHP